MLNIVQMKVDISIAFSFLHWTYVLKIILFLYTDGKKYHIAHIECDVQGFIKRKNNSFSSTYMAAYVKLDSSVCE